MLINIKKIFLSCVKPSARSIIYIVLFVLAIHIWIRDAHKEKSNENIKSDIPVDGNKKIDHFQDKEANAKGKKLLDGEFHNFGHIDPLKLEQIPKNLLKKRKYLDQSIHVGFQIQQKEDIPVCVLAMKSILLFTKSRVNFHLFSGNSLATNAIKALKRIYHVTKFNALFSFHSYNDTAIPSLAKKKTVFRKCSSHTIVCMALRLLEESIAFKRIILLNTPALVLTDLQALYSTFDNFREDDVFGLIKIEQKNTKSNVQTILFDLDKGISVGLKNTIYHGFITGLFKYNDNDYNILKAYLDASKSAPYWIDCTWDFQTTSDICSAHFAASLCPSTLRNGLNIWHMQSDKNISPNEQSVTNVYNRLSKTVHEIKHSVEDTPQYWTDVFDILSKTEHNCDGESVQYESLLKRLKDNDFH